MRQKGSASLIIVFTIILLVALVAGYFYLQKTNTVPESVSKIVDSQKPQPQSKQESPDSTVTRYSLEEFKSIFAPNSNETCLQTVLPLVHPFPGYKYEKLTGITREGGIYDEKANVLISLTARGLVDAQALKDFSEENREDSYTFEMYYDESKNTCKISDQSNIFNWLFPQEISDEAIELAKKDFTVQHFFEKYKNIHLSYVDWLEVGRSEYTNNRDLLRLVSDRNSVYVYLGLNGKIENTQFGVSVPVLVDVKNKNVIIGEETVADSIPK